MSRSDRAPSVLHAKIVYYGPEQSGKTAMLQSLHRRLDPDGQVRLYSVDSGDERTLFFDLLPVQEIELGPYRVRTRLFSTPGRERYQAVRRCVLAHADAIVFVADAQEQRLDDNRASLLDLERNLEANGIDPARIPLVIAANKSDLEGVLTGEHLRAVLLERECPVIETCAPQGQGVVDVFTKALRKMLGIAAVRTNDESSKAALLPSKDLLRHLLQPGEPGRATPDEIAGRRIVVSVPTPEPAPENGSDRQLCDELAAGAVIAQTRLADLYEEVEASHRTLESRNRELLAVNRVSRSILSAMDTDNLLVVLLDVVTRHLQASHASFVIFDSTTRDGLRTHIQGFGKDPLLELPVEGARAFFDLIRNSDAPVAFNERNNVPLFKELRRIDGRIHRAICSAVKTRGKPTGWLAVYQFAGEQPLDTHSLLLLSSLSGLASLGLEKISLLAEVQRFNQRLEEEVQGPVEIDGQALVGGGDELGLPEGAGPRPVELVERQVATVDQLEGGDQLAAPEFRPPPAQADQRRQGMGQEIAAGFPAVVGFDPPHRRDHVAIDAVAPLGRPQHIVISGHHRAAVADPLFVDQEAEIVPDRYLEFGLGLRQAQDLLVRLRPVESGGRDRRTDPGSGSVPLQAAQAGGKPGRRRRTGRQHRQGSDQDRQSHPPPPSKRPNRASDRAGSLPDSRRRARCHGNVC